MKYSSNITIQGCSFQHSKERAVVLSDISGNVNISHCKFVNNSHYRGHGAAISYSSSSVINHLIPLLFQICNCIFTHNEGAKSLVSFKNRISRWNNDIILCGTKFYHNQGGSIYVVNHNVSFSGKSLFQNNTATFVGRVIYCIY